MAWFLRGMLRVGGMLMLANKASTYALPQGDVSGGNNNVFTFPVGGVVDSRAPVVISWIPSTPGPVTITLTEGAKTREIAARVENTGSFVWPIPPDLDTTIDGGKYNLQIMDEVTKESTFAQPFEILPRSDTPPPKPTAPAPTTKPILVITSFTTLPRPVKTVKPSSASSVKPPSITDTTLLLDLSSAPTGNPTIAPPPLVTTDSVIGGSAPNVGIIAGATVGACVAAGLLLIGAIIVWRRKRGTEQMHQIEEEHIHQEQKEMERQSAIDTYGRTGGMVNAF